MKSTNYLQKTPVVCLLAVFCCFLWGSAFPSIKLGYEWFGIQSHDSFSQIMFAGCRFMLAGVLTILLGSVIRHQWLIPKKSSLRYLISLSLFQTILQYLFFYIGLANTTGVKASIIEGANVFVAIIIASIFAHQEKLEFNKVLGCLIGFVGVVLVNLNGSHLELSFHLQGEGFILISTVAYAISSVLIKSYSKRENAVILSGYQFILGGFVMFLCGFFGGGKFAKVSSHGILMLIYLALVSAVAYTIWAILLTYNSVSKVTVFGFTNPVFGVLLSMLLLKENNQSLGLKGIIALFLVCFGIYIVNMSKESENIDNELGQ